MAVSNKNTAGIIMMCCIQFRNTMEYTSAEMEITKTERKKSHYF